MRVRRSSGKPFPSVRVPFDITLPKKAHLSIVVTLSRDHKIAGQACTIHKCILTDHLHIFSNPDCSAG